MPMRFTTPGDTVLGISKESTELPETDLAQGRRLELYHVGESSTESLKERTDNAFLKSYNSSNSR